MIAARRTHDHYLAHRSFSISGRRFEGALARIIRRESGAALPGPAASPRYRKAWGQFGQAVGAIENDEAFTCGYAVVFFVGHAVVHVPFIKSIPAGPVQRDSPLNSRLLMTLTLRRRLDGEWAVALPV